MTSLATTQCRICGSGEVRHHATMPSLRAGAADVTFLACNACETVFDPSGNTFDYVPEPDKIDDAWPAYQYHFEMSAGVAILAKMVHLAQTIAPRGLEGIPRRFLDIGGGVGLTCEIAQRLGWDTVNFEPGAPGYFGERMLDVKVVHGYLAPGMMPAHSFQAIMSSEVIEHVPDPDEFVSLIAGYLADDGVAILTTPNSAPTLHSAIGETELAETYCPGMHLNLFSARSLEQVLRRNGFADVRIFTSDGISGQKRLFALACRRAGMLPHDVQPLLDQPAIDKICVDHLQWVVDTRAQDNRYDAWYHGACFRLCEHYVSIGDFEQAEPYMALIDAHLLERGLTNEVVPLIQAGNFLDFMRQVPAYLGKYCYFRGMYELLHTSDAAAARTWFRSAGHICAIQEGVITFVGHFSFLARFHEGLALLRMERAEEAIGIFDELDRQSDHLPKHLRDRIRWQRAMTRLQRGNDADAVGQLAALAMENLDFIEPAMREPLKHIIIACAQRAESLRDQLRTHVGRLENMARQVAHDVTGLKPQLVARLEQVDRLALRGEELARHVHAQLAEGISQLTNCAALGAEVGRKLQQQAQAASERVSGLLEHGQLLAERLESHVSEGTAHLNHVAARSTELAQRIEKGLARANDTGMRLQNFVERNQEPAQELAARCSEILTALESTARTMQRTASMFHHGLATIGAVAGFPLRVARGAWRAARLPSRRVSLRQIGMRRAMRIEGRIPLGEIVPGVTVEQNVVARQKGLSAVALTFGTCQRTNHCTLNVALVDGQDQIVREAVVAADSLPDNRPHRIDFAPLADSEGKSYRVRVTSRDASSGNAVTLWTRLCDSRRGLSYNGKPIVDAELTMEASYS